jgi:transcriptional regulator with XRE-family HTH domain
MDAVTTGRALQALRQSSGLTQQGVGAEFGISKQAVADWEAGKSRPDIRKLRKLDELYGAGGQVLALYDLGEGEVSQLRAEVARLARAVDQIADVLGVTLDAGLPPHSTDVDPPDDVGQPPSS